MSGSSGRTAAPGTANHTLATPGWGQNGAHSIRILLVDDHAVFRQALCMLLQAQSGLEVVGDAGSGREAIDLAEKLRPDIVLLDILMAEMNGIEVAKALARRAPAARIIMLTAMGNREIVVDALRAGATGFVIKRANIDELMLAIALVARGHHYVSDELTQAFDVGDLILEARMALPTNPIETLTAREREIVSLLSEGYTTREIAERLFLSEKTVDGHKSRAMVKLGVHVRAGLVRAAIQYGLTSLEPLR